jgi:hypothetical protein
MKSQFRELVRNSAWIYGFIAFALLASLALDITGVAQNELFPGAIFFLPSLFAFVYCVAPALLFRFAIVRRPLHWAIASAYVVIAYFGWFVLMVALTGEPYNRPSYMVLLSLVAAWKILCFRQTLEATMPKSAAATNPGTAVPERRVDHESTKACTDMPVSAAEAPGRDPSTTSRSPALLFAPETSLRVVSFLAAAACAVALAASGGQWVDFNSAGDFAFFTSLFVLPTIAGAFFYLMGWMWAGCVAFVPIAFFSFGCVVYEGNPNGASFVWTMALIAMASPFVRLALRRCSGTKRHSHANKR